MSSSLLNTRIIKEMTEPYEIHEDDRQTTCKAEPQSIHRIENRVPTSPAREEGCASPVNAFDVLISSKSEDVEEERDCPDKFKEAVNEIRKIRKHVFPK